MPRNILIVGFSQKFIEAIAHREDLNIYVIEEEELYRNNNIEKYKYPLVKEVIITEYIHSEVFLDVVTQMNKQLNFCAVIPAREYTVRTSAMIAEMLKLPGLGVKAARFLTDKTLLREFCAENEIPHPRFQKIATLEELQAFFHKKSVIFKPANRQASLGISKIESYADIQSAWEYTTSAKEDGRRIVSRQIPIAFIAEEYIDGFEVSIETLVQDGKSVFHNITAKTTYEENFIELQHVAPAQLDPLIQQSLIKNKENFITALQVQDGILHSEWKVEDGEPYIIECAGRTPGDCIVDLISESYQFNFYNEFCNLLCGDVPQVKQHPSKISAIRFFRPKPGVLKEIKGEEILQQPKIIASSITVKPGDTIGSVRSSWDRVGYFIVTAENDKELSNIIQGVLGKVEFVLQKDSDDLNKEMSYKSHT